MESLVESLKKRIEARTARAGVMGLGFAGLPLAVELARAGFPVVGLDVDRERVEMLRAGRSYIPDVADATVASALETGRVTFTTDFDALAALDTVNICVPTPLSKTKDPDLSCVVRAAEEIGKRLRPGQLIVLESTTYPGTTQEIVRPLLEESQAVGAYRHTPLRAGRDFFLAFSPERVDPGNRRFTIRNVPKVVGGLTPQCTQLACLLYAQCVEQVVPVSSPRVAEMVKLLENTFRAVNIGLVNEVALMCDRFGIDVWEVIEAAKTKPFGFMAFYPGPGLGGHCVPIDPIYLSWKARQDGFEPRLVELATRLNASMPPYVVQKVAGVLNARERSLKGSHILLLGVAYKKNINDVRESPALDILGLLLAGGARVSYHDPHVPELAFQGREWRSEPLTPGLLESADVVLLLTDHDALDLELIHRHARSIVDTRNAFRVGGPTPGLPGGKVVKL